jgi:putative ABC transport system substrate-binding protein
VRGSGHDDFPLLVPFRHGRRVTRRLSYATDPSDGVRHAGIYAAKILNGAKPGDLPIEQASKFTFVINLKTAKATLMPP